LLNWSRSGSTLEILILIKDYPYEKNGPASLEAGFFYYVPGFCTSIKLRCVAHFRVPPAIHQANSHNLSSHQMNQTKRSTGHNDFSKK